MYNIKVIVKRQNLSDNITDQLDHEITFPTKELPSQSIKNIKDDVITFNYYSDLNIEAKKIIENTLKSNSYYQTSSQFFNKIKKLTEDNRYFIQTDIIGAYYNFTFDNIFKVLKTNVKDQFIYNYLFGFFNYIKNTYEKVDYLYITDYSEYIFALFLENIFKPRKIIFKKDDILFYGDEMSVLKNSFKEMSCILAEYLLYFNTKKTFYIDTFYDSIYIFKTIVTTPRCQILDEKVMSKIKKAMLKSEQINIYELNDELYNYISVLSNDIIEKTSFHPSIKIKYYKNISFYKKLFYNFFEYYYQSSTVNNNLIYTEYNRIIKRMIEFKDMQKDVEIYIEDDVEDLNNDYEERLI